MEAERTFTFFWKTSSPFSQWYPCRFRIGPVTFNCAEQYMMYQKALLFGDRQTGRQILAATSQKQQKALGRMVREFDPVRWEKHREGIVYDGNYAKFTQNRRLLGLLLDTGDTVLVEASPNDCVWGIGLLADHPDARNPENWRGLNLLGKIVTALRHDLRDDLRVRATPVEQGPRS